MTTSTRLDHLRLRQLRFLTLLADQGSLAAVAEGLAMTPSAASMMLKEIETLVGAKLFRRQGRGMAMTETARALLPRCRTVLGELAAMGATLHSTDRPLLRLGAFPHTTTTVLPGIVEQLLSATPAWRLQIVDGSAEQLLADLLDGRIDLLLGRLPMHRADAISTGRLRQRVLYEGSLSVVAARNHPLAGRRSVPMSALLDWPWVLPGLQSTTRLALIDAFQRHGLPPPTPVVESPSFFYSLSIVARTRLLGCCAQSAALHGGQATSILPVKLGSDPVPVSMFWRTGSHEAQRAVDGLT